MSRDADPELAAGLGRAILARRHELNKSQEALAYESDVSIRQLQKIESGKNSNALIGNIYSIARALDLTFAEFAERVDRAMAGKRRRA